jgi:hypothetical protein
LGHEAFQNLTAVIASLALSVLLRPSVSDATDEQTLIETARAPLVPATVIFEMMALHRSNVRRVASPTPSLPAR